MEINSNVIIFGTLTLGILMCIFGGILGGLIGYDIGNDEVKTTIETKIVYINQTDNCLNEIVKIFDEAKEIKKTVMEYLEVKNETSHNTG